MIIDGKELANEIKDNIKEEIRRRKVPPILFIVSVGNNPVSEKFLGVKKRFADAIGIIMQEKKFAEDISTERLIEEIVPIAQKENSGIIVQLPLPKTIDTQAILNAIPPEKDPDVLGDKAVALFEEGISAILPPVVGAMKEILLRSGTFVGDKKVVIVGRGKLVGAPAAVWFKRHGSNVTLLGRDTKDLKSQTLDADIIVLGSGNPAILKPAMIKPGVVILDAGTSEANGKLAGDADPLCVAKAGVFTPVPGGVGPLTVAMLFKNLMELTKIKVQP